VDFYSPEYKLGIEADGGQHYEDRGRQQDELRTKELANLGVKILRFNNLDILNNIEGVYQVIQEAIKNNNESPSP
jgi:very-short-patch-repair endonuclease